MSRTALVGTRDWRLHHALPRTPLSDVAELYAGVDGKRQTEYSWNGWDFHVGEGVFVPSPASRMLTTALLDGTIPVAGKSYAAMGVGVGAELVTAGHMGASTLFGLDIHPASVDTAVSNYAQISGSSGVQAKGIVSDLWDALPPRVEFDVVTFNPPFAEVATDDPDVRRNRGGGLHLAERFLGQTAARSVLRPDGRLYLVLANTEPMKQIVALALDRGFTIECLSEDADQASVVRTFLLALSVATTPGSASMSGTG